MQLSRILSIALALGLSMGILSTVQAQQDITPEQARAIAKEAYIYANPVLDSYRVIHGYFLDPEDPEFKAPLNGFFIPNDRKKYSVGENGGMQLNEDGGIEIYVAEKKPEGVPEENWLPLNRGDYGIDVVLRLYVPYLEEFANWEPPKAEKL